MSARKPGAPVASDHYELCLRAQRWLKTAGCGVTAVELVSFAQETPDAIGWRQGQSILCEAKASRADFLADKKKPWRIRPELGMGDWRFFVAPFGMISPSELPERWGLLEWDGKRMLRTHAVPRSALDWSRPPFVGHKQRESLVLCSLIRRLENPAADRRKARPTLDPEPAVPAQTQALSG